MSSLGVSRRAPSDLGQIGVNAEALPEKRVAGAMVTCPKTHGPESGVKEINALFKDEHVHLALIVGAVGRLLTTIERSDLASVRSSALPVVTSGTLEGRTVGPSDSLVATTPTFPRQGRRRLAVVDHSGRLLGLLCLRKDATGYCSDESTPARSNQAKPPCNGGGTDPCRKSPPEKGRVHPILGGSRWLGGQRC